MDKYVKYECITQRGTSLACLAITKERIFKFGSQPKGEEGQSLPRFLGRGPSRVFLIITTTIIINIVKLAILHMLTFDLILDIFI